MIVEWKDTINPHAKGWIVIDKLINNTAGGGIFMHPKASLKEVQDLAHTMTMKNSFQNPIHGGAKAGICYDSHNIDAVDVLKRFLMDNLDLIKNHWCTAADLNTSNDIIQNYCKELGVGSGFFSLGNVIAKQNNYSQNQAFFLIERIKKKPNPFFTLGNCSTGYGVAQTIDLMKTTKLPRVVIQGFGAVGSSLAYFLYQQNIAKVVGIIESDCSIYSSHSLPVLELIEGLTSYQNNISERSKLYQFIQNLSSSHNFVIKYKNKKESSINFLNNFLTSIKADIFSPCALRYQITEHIFNTLVHHTFAGNKNSFIICGANNAFENKKLIDQCPKYKITTIPEWVSNSGNATLFVESLKEHDFSTWESDSLKKIKDKITLFLLKSNELCSDQISLYDACYLLVEKNIKTYEKN